MPRLVRTITVLFALSLAVPSLGNAAGWYAGAKGGVNMAELIGDEVENSESKNGFIGGGFVGTNFNRNFGLRIEALAVEKGATGTIVTPGSDHSHESEWTLTYIEMPLLLTGAIPLGSRWALNAFAGPTFGANVKSDILTTHGLTEFRDRTETFELGAAFGGGLEYKLATWSLFAEGRYGLGLQSITDVPDVDVKNRGIAIMGGVSFSTP